LIKFRTSIKPGNPTLWQGLTVRSNRNYYSLTSKSNSGYIFISFIVIFIYTFFGWLINN